MLNVFSCAYLSRLYTLWWNSVPIFCPFLLGLFGLVLLLSSESSLYSLDTSSLSGRWFANIISQAVAWLFIRLVGSFTEIQFINFFLLRTVLLVSCLSTLGLVLWPKDFLFFFFFPQSFLVLYFTFKSMIPFGLIFVLI